MLLPDARFSDETENLRQVLAMSPETAVVEGDGLAARPLIPPTVTPSSSGEVLQDVSSSDDDVEAEDFMLEQTVGGILREVERLKKTKAFPELDSFGVIDQKHDTYLGPTMESNWVLPGKLLVGAYPASMNDTHHAHLLCTILLQGVSTFVCLQQEYRAHGVTEEMWRSGEALRPYFQDVLQLLRKLRELKASDPRAVPVISAPDATDFVHFPIVDCNVADDTKVLQLAARLAARVARGEVLYLHCWGGHGRTGTVVSIMLHLMYGLSAEEAMERCQFVHDIRRIPINVGSPQTEAQREQVRRVVSRVERRAARSAAAAAAATAGLKSPAKLKVPSVDMSEGENVAVDVEGSPGVKKSGGSAGGMGKSEVGAVGDPAGPAVVGGRRGWVRGRRQAFAQAPNGVGEDVSGWLAPGDDEQTVVDATAAAAVAVAVTTPPGGKSGVEQRDGCGGEEVAATTRAGRRKSLTEEGFQQDDKNTRRKSAPGQSPRSAELEDAARDEAAAKEKAAAENEAGATGVGTSGPMESCGVVEKSVTRSAGGGRRCSCGKHGCVREPGTVKCGGRRLQ